MFPDQSVRQNASAREAHTRRRESHSSAGQPLRRYRVGILLALALFGLHLLTAGSVTGKAAPVPIQSETHRHEASVQMGQVSQLPTPASVGLGAAAVASQRMNAESLSASL